ncbi:SOUL heme-binding family protein [Euphorbia peplus]|nr:SOUL heme-binding family protein [Euphorbia peplus]
MGLILGKISVETPKYQLLKSTTEYEIRKYLASVAAEFTYNPSQMKEKDAFMVLAKYIGAFGTPENKKTEQIAMTAPVMTTNTGGEKIAMTAPVMTKEDGQLVTMQFVLPEKYKRAVETPSPADERVVIREEGERKYGVVKFGGVATEKVVEEKVEMLKKSLERDEYKVIGKYILGRYNPPWRTLPFLRTNEVLIPIE